MSLPRLANGLKFMLSSTVEPCFGFGGIAATRDVGRLRLASKLWYSWFFFACFLTETAELMLARLPNGLKPVLSLISVEPAK